MTLIAQGGNMYFSVQPTHVRADKAITPAVVVTLDNSDEEKKITISLKPNFGLQGTLTHTTVEGKATFKDLAVSTIGSYKLVATTPDAEPVSSDAFTVG